MNTAMMNIKKVLGSDIFWDAVSVAKDAHPAWVMDKIAKMQNGDEIDRAHAAVLEFFRPEEAKKLARKEKRQAIVSRIIQDNYRNISACDDLMYLYDEDKVAILNTSQVRVNGYGSAKFEGWDSPSPILLKLVIDGYKVFVQTSRTLDEINEEYDSKWRALVPRSRIFCRPTDSHDVFNDDGEKIYDPRNTPWMTMFELLGWAPPSRPDLGPNAWRLKASAYGAFIGTIEQVTALGLKMEDCGSYIPRPPKIDPAVFNSPIGKKIRGLIAEYSEENDPTTQVSFDIWNFVGGFCVKVHCRSVLVLEAMERSIRAEPKPAFAYAEKLAIRVNLDSIKIEDGALRFDVFSEPAFRSKEFREFVSKLTPSDSVALKISELCREDDDWTVIVEFKMSPAALAKDIEGKPIL